MPDDLLMRKRGRDMAAPMAKSEKNDMNIFQHN
jgi:hypothetical protein